MRRYGSEQVGMSAGACQFQHGLAFLGLVDDQSGRHDLAFVRLAARRGRCPRTPAGLCHFCCLGAEGGGEAIHDVAASAQILAGIGRALRKAAQDQQAVGGEFAGIFGRRMELHFHVQEILSEKRLRYKSAA